MNLWGLAGVLAVLVGGSRAVATQSDPGLPLRAFRYYRAENNQTRVTAFAEIPLSAMSAASNGELSYNVRVKVTDSTGLTLYENGWTSHARQEMKDAGASSMEVVEFSLAPGKFRLDVSVEDSVSGATLSSGVDLKSYTASPVASDLMLSPAMRPATDGDTLPRPGERRWGNTLVTAATTLRLTPLRARAFYLLEAYADKDEAGTMSVVVSDTTGHALVKTPATPVQVAGGGSVLKGQLDLTGLPAGTYQLAVDLTLGGKTEERSDRLVMADFQQTMDKEAARLSSDKVSDEGYFGQMNEQQLDTAYAPLVYLTTRDQLSVYKKDLSLTAKRQFMTRFWQARDPTKGTPRNEAREDFYALIDYANKNFREGGRKSLMGWNTDRGRVFLRHKSEPPEKLDRPIAAGKAPPYLVWRYTTGKGEYYIFADLSGVGGFQLLYSNDLKEVSKSDWKEILGSDALQDVSRWLNVDFFRTQQ
jgi:GWxTD domain-containing protein